MLKSKKKQYSTKFFFQVVIVIAIPAIYVIYGLFARNHIFLSLTVSSFLYLIIARNVKKGVFFEDYIIVYFPFKFINKQKKIAYNTVTRVKRGSSYYEGECLIIYFMNKEKRKKMVLGYPSEKNKVGIVNILENYEITIDEFY